MNTSSRKTTMALSVVVGLLFLSLGALYVMRGAGSLPTWLPGYEAGSTHIHVKHAVASFLLGVAAFVFAWFQSGPKSTAPGTTPKA